jgi:hypothetical protein
MPENDRIERALIEQKKEILRQRYGARFSGYPGTLPPEVERAWLDYVIEFEAASRDAALTTVRHFIGDPVFGHITDIPEDRIPVELEKAVEILASNGVFVDFINPSTSVREQYRFITEELLDEQIEDFRVDGLEIHYLYEAYHPDDEEDVRRYGVEFLAALFTKSRSALDALLPDGECYNSEGERIPPDKFSKQTDRFLNSFTSFICHRAEPLLTQVEGDYATVEIDVIWHGISSDSLRASGTGIARLRLKRSDSGRWGVIQVCLPGWQF